MWPCKTSDVLVLLSAPCAAFSWVQKAERRWSTCAKRVESGRLSAEKSLVHVGPSGWEWFGICLVSTWARVAQGNHRVGVGNSALAPIPSSPSRPCFYAAGRPCGVGSDGIALERGWISSTKVQRTAKLCEWTLNDAITFLFYSPETKLLFSPFVDSSRVKTPPQHPRTAFQRGAQILHCNSFCFIAFLSEREPQILDYKTQQYKVLPPMAASYAFRFAASRVWKMFVGQSQEMASGDYSSIQEVNYGPNRFNQRALPNTKTPNAVLTLSLTKFKKHRIASVIIFHLSKL